MAYKVSYKQSVERDLRKLPKAEVRRILAKVERDLPRRADQCPILTGEFAGLRRMRAGDYRVIFAVVEDEVVVLRIGHRKDVYRKGR